MLSQAQCVYLKSASMGYNNGEENATFNSGTLLPENHCNRNLAERAMLPSFNHRTWTSVHLSPGRQAKRKGKKNERGPTVT